MTVVTVVTTVGVAVAGALMVVGAWWSGRRRDLGRDEFPLWPRD